MNLMRSVCRWKLLASFGFRSVCSLFLLGGLCVPLVMGETLTLQLPFARLSHSFTLRELHSSGTASPGWPNLGYPAGNYISHPVDQLELVGGDFDANGVWQPWQPGSAPMVQAFVDRIGTGFYFIVDETASEASRPNQLALADGSPWLSLNSSTYGMYFSIETSRASHLIALWASGSNWSGWFPVTVASSSAWLQADGSASSLGYIEARTYLPQAPSSWALVDLTAAQYGGAPDTVGPVSFIYPFSPGSGPIAQARIRVPYYGQSFSLMSPDGALQTASSTTPHGDGYTWDVIFSVGVGREFWLVRTSDSAVSGLPWTMDFDGVQEDATVAFAANGWLDQDIQTRVFRVGTHLNPASLRFRRSVDWNNPLPLTVSSTLDSITLSYPDGAQEVVYFKSCSITADVAGGWSITDASGNDLGQGPDFINWPQHTAQYFSIALPATRATHLLETDFGAVLVTNGLPETYSARDEWTGDWYDFDYVWFDTMMPWSGGTFSVSDLTSGDSPGTVYGYPNTQIFDFVEWHPPLAQILKISATRWTHNLQIRIANGEVVSLDKHQVHGDWSWDPIGQQGWFNSYGFFDATATVRAAIPWHLYDVTRGEVLSSAPGDANDFIDATDNTDADSDELPDWYEAMIGTNPNAVDTDGDGVNDKAELLAGTNPRAASVASLPTSTLQVYTLLK